MSDTETINVDDNWQQLNLNVGESFTFSNQGPAEVYVRESILEPTTEERGYTFMSGSGGWGVIELSPMWVRTKFGKSVFHFGVFIPD
jgi:hypothetical protein